jgi:hypothetical protein
MTLHDIKRIAVEEGLVANICPVHKHVDVKYDEMDVESIAFLEPDSKGRAPFRRKYRDSAGPVDDIDPKTQLQSWIEYYGLSINNPTIQKLIDMQKYGNPPGGLPGGSPKGSPPDKIEIDQLKKGQRLVALVDRSPIYGYKSTPHLGGYLVYAPENQDVVNLILSLPRYSIVQDIIHGLAFGYGIDNIVNWVKHMVKWKRRKFNSILSQ